MDFQRRVRFQPSLRLGAPRDQHERQAEQVARQVTARLGLAPATPQPSAAGHRRASTHPAPHGHPRPAGPQRRPALGLPPAGRPGQVSPEIQQAISRAPAGQPLPSPVRTGLGQALNADFRAVRLHTDAQADQLSHVLGARAFTTGQHIFFRSGEYRPGHPAGQHLLAHELTHVTQQNPATRHPAPAARQTRAGRQSPAPATAVASTQAPAPAPASGTIQRVVIDGFDTEERVGLRRLKSKAGNLETLEAATAMLRLVPQPGTVNENELAQELTAVVADLTAKKQRADEQAERQRRRAAEAAAAAETDRQQHEQRVRRAAEQAESQRQREEEDARQEREKNARLAAERQRQREEQDARQERDEAAERAARLDASRTARQRQIAEQNALAEAAEEQQIAAFRAKAKDVLALTAQLNEGTRIPDDTQAWLGVYAQFSESEEQWAKALEDKPRAAATRPDLITFTREVARAISSAKERKSAIDQAQANQLAQEQAGREQRTMLTRREQEVKEKAPMVDRYLELQVGNRPEPVGLFLRWLLSAGLDRLIGHADPLTAALLGHLADLRTHGRAAGDEQPQGGPAVFITSDPQLPQGVTGQARDNGLELTVGLANINPMTRLISIAPEDQSERNQQADEVAKGFIHEAAHVWQIRRYGHSSHPWKPKASDSTGHPVGMPWDEVHEANWPADVRTAYQELAAGGVDGAAKQDPEWQRAFKAMTHREYLNLPSRDRRGREIVSHLMEIVYAWNSPEKFRRIFPASSALLDRVIRHGNDVA